MVKVYEYTLKNVRTGETYGPLSRPEAARFIRRDSDTVKVCAISGDPLRSLRDGDVYIISVSESESPTRRMCWGSVVKTCHVWRNTRVRRISDGVVFKDIYEAAEAVGGAPQKMITNIQRNQKFRGDYYEFVDK